MSYTLSKKITELLPLVASKYGVEIIANLLRDKEGCQAFSDICGKKDQEGKFLCKYCQSWNGQQREVEISSKDLPDQIKQILIALEKVLEENPEILKINNQGYGDCRLEYSGDHYLIIDYWDDIREIGYIKYSEALCQKWLDGLNPLITTNPDQVLSELIEVLENLL